MCDISIYVKKKARKRERLRPNFLHLQIVISWQCKPMYFDLPLLEELVLMQQQLKSVSRPRGNLSKRTVIIDEKHVVGCLELVVSHSSDALSSLKLLTPWMDAKSMLNTHKWANRVTIAGEDMMIVKENRINWCCWVRFKAKVAVICRLLSIPTNTQPMYHGIDSFPSIP